MTSLEGSDADFSDSDSDVSMESVDMSKMGEEDDASDTDTEMEKDEEEGKEIEVVKKKDIAPVDETAPKKATDETNPPPEFSEADSIVDDDATASKTIEEIYKSATQEELVANLSEHSDLVPKQFVLLLMGVYARYIKFEPNKDLFGMELSKYLKDKNAMYKTVTCEKMVEHINVPSLNSDLKVKNVEYSSIFAYAAIENEPNEIIGKLKAKGSISFEDESTTSTLAPNTPFPELELEETEEGKGYVVGLLGDKLEIAFNFLNCPSVLMDDSSPKKVPLSLILKTLADCNVEKVTIVNLATKKNASETNAVVVSASANEEYKEMKMKATEDVEGSDMGEEEEEEEEEAPAATETDVEMKEAEAKEGETPVDETPAADETPEVNETVAEVVQGAAEAAVAPAATAEAETKTAQGKPPKLSLGSVITDSSTSQSGGRKTKQLKFKKKQKSTRKKR
jgi:hypothetical protein